MPLLGTLIASAFGVLIQFMGWLVASEFRWTWVRRMFIIALGSALVAGVTLCLSTLYQALGALLSAAPAKFAMGVGMFIPSNAAVVLGCMFSVWLACMVYRMKLQGLQW